MRVVPEGWDWFRVRGLATWTAGWWDGERSGAPVGWTWLAGLFGGTVHSLCKLACPGEGARPLRHCPPLRTALNALMQSGSTTSAAVLYCLELS